MEKSQSGSGGERSIESVSDSTLQSGPWGLLAKAPPADGAAFAFCNTVRSFAAQLVIRSKLEARSGVKAVTSIARVGSPYCGIPLSNIAIAVTANTDSVDPAVSRFLDAVCREQGLSQNTLAAYRADLTALARWLAGRNVPIMRTTRA